MTLRRAGPRGGATARLPLPSGLLHVLLLLMGLLLVPPAPAVGAVRLRGGVSYNPGAISRREHLRRFSAAAASPTARTDGQDDYPHNLRVRPGCSNCNLTLWKRTLEAKLGRAMERHPEVFGLPGPRPRDWRTQIEDLEHLQLRADVVASHMSDAYPSIEAGDRLHGRHTQRDVESFHALLQPAITGAGPPRAIRRRRKWFQAIMGAAPYVKDPDLFLKARLDDAASSAATGGATGGAIGDADNAISDTTVVRATELGSAANSSADNNETPMVD